MISTNNETDALRAELYAARRSAGSLQQSLSQVSAASATDFFLANRNSF